MPCSRVFKPSSRWPAVTSACVILQNTSVKSIRMCRKTCKKNKWPGNRDDPMKLSVAASEMTCLNNDQFWNASRSFRNRCCKKRQREVDGMRRHTNEFRDVLVLGKNREKSTGRAARNRRSWPFASTERSRRPGRSCSTPMADRNCKPHFVRSTTRSQRGHLPNNLRRARPAAVFGSEAGDH